MNGFDLHMNTNGKCARKHFSRSGARGFAMMTNRAKKWRTKWKQTEGKWRNYSNKLKHKVAWKQRQILEIIYCCSFVYNRFIAAVFFSVHFFCLLPRQFIYLRDNVWSSLWHDCMLNANRKWLIKCNSQTIFPPRHVASRNRSRVMTRLRNQAIEISPINRLKEVA